MMRLAQLTQIVFHLNHLIDDKVFVSVEEAKERIQRDDLLKYLGSLDSKFNSSVYVYYEKEEVVDLCRQLNQWCDDLGPEGVGVHNNGLCVILSGIINLIQRKSSNILFDK